MEFIIIYGETEMLQVNKYELAHIHTYSKTYYIPTAYIQGVSYLMLSIGILETVRVRRLKNKLFRYTTLLSSP